MCSESSPPRDAGSRHSPVRHAAAGPNGAATAVAVDRHRLEHLFHAHYAELCAYVHGIVASTATAEDLVQELFATIWRQRTDRPLDDIERAYLYTAARRRALNHLRRARLEQRWAREQLAPPRPSVPTPEEEAAAWELENSARRVLEQLPPRCQEAFLLVRGRGLKYAEAAELMGISVKTIEVQIGKALQALRAALLRSSS